MGCSGYWSCDQTQNINSNHSSAGELGPLCGCRDILLTFLLPHLWIYCFIGGFSWGYVDNFGDILYNFLALYGLMVGTLSGHCNWLFSSLETYCVLLFMLAGGGHHSLQKGHPYSRLSPYSKHSKCNQLTWMMLGENQCRKVAHVIITANWLEWWWGPCSRLSSCSKCSQLTCMVLGTQLLMQKGDLHSKFDPCSQLNWMVVGATDHCWKVTLCSRLSPCSKCSQLTWIMVGSFISAKRSPTADWPNVANAGNFAAHTANPHNNLCVILTQPDISVGSWNILGMCSWWLWLENLPEKLSVTFGKRQICLGTRS